MTIDTDSETISAETAGSEATGTEATGTETLADRAVRRSLASREAAARAEVQRLLDATLALVRKGDGDGPPRVADIVSEAGLSNQAFYRHFAGRDELLAAVAEAGTSRLVSYLGHLMEKEQDPLQQLRRWIEGVLAQASRQDVARETRAVMLPSRARRKNRWSSDPLVAARDLLLEPLRSLGSSDPDRDAEVIGAAVFDRLDHFLWEAEPTAADVEHLVRFCQRAVTGAPC